MAITNGYCTLDELKARLNIQLGDTTDDAMLENSIEAASRTVDGMCARHFYSATETHYYDAEQWDEIEVDDLVSVTTLKTDEDQDRVYETTWGATDFELGPGDSAPYTRIYATPTGSHAFPVWQRKAVQVVGTFGWSAVPDAVREASLLLAARYHSRRNTPLGIQVGKPEFGNLSIPGKDPDVERLLMPYRRFALIGV